MELVVMELVVTELVVIHLVTVRMQRIVMHRAVRVSADMVMVMKGAVQEDPLDIGTQVDTCAMRAGAADAAKMEALAASGGVAQVRKAM
jgi:hypothetical protein